MNNGIQSYSKKKNEADELTHWKYIKREKVNDKWRYYYDTDKAERDESTKLDSSSVDVKSIDSKDSDDGFDLEELAKKVIRGEFGNGADRKDLLGESYEEVQKRVNELLRGGTNNKSSNLSSDKTTNKGSDSSKRRISGYTR